MKIDLYELTKNGEIRNLSGKERGRDARSYFCLDIKDRDEGVTFVVTAPNELYAISSSFFLGLFSQSLQNLGGRDEFLAKYFFDMDEHLLRQINHGIDRCLMSRSSLRECGNQDTKISEHSRRKSDA